MLAYFTKPILELIPEARDLIKQASLEVDLPTDSRSSTAASALAIAYASNISGQPLDVDAMTKVASAVKLYDLEATLQPLKKSMIKRAHERMVNTPEARKHEYLTKQASFHGDYPNQKAAAAEHLIKEAQEVGETPTEQVLRYSGSLSLSKKASVEALASRYERTNNLGFAKLACAIYALPDFVKQATVQDICKTVTNMDLELGLHFQGYDFYKEALITKEAAVSALTVKLCGKDVPYESIQRAGRPRVAQYLGEDVACEMDKGPENAKAVFETLPMDLQTLLMNVVQNA